MSAAPTPRIASHLEGGMFFGFYLSWLRRFDFIPPQMVGSEAAKAARLAGVWLRFHRRVSP